MSVMDKVQGMLRRKHVTPYEKLQEALEQRNRARMLAELTTSAAWPLIREWFLSGAESMQAKQNALSEDPYANAAEIVHLNTARRAREELVAEVESCAAEFPVWRDRVEELDNLIKTAEALKRASDAG